MKTVTKINTLSELINIVEEEYRKIIHSIVILHDFNEKLIPVDIDYLYMHYTLVGLTKLIEDGLYSEEIAVEE